MERESMISFAMPFIKANLLDFSICKEQLGVIALTLGLLLLVWSVALSLIREMGKKELENRLEESRKHIEDTKEYIFDFTK